MATESKTANSADQPPPVRGSLAAWAQVAMTTRGWWQAAAVVTLVGLYLMHFAYRGWIPHDEGLLAESAERVLAGELPHRDFDDTYTGGLSYLHALAFQLFGRQLASLRTMLFPFVLVFVCVLYALAARATPPWLAALVVFTCVAWSVPNYFVALPSWYVLFFVTLGVWNLLRYADTGRRRWLFCAGLCGGIGVLFKIVAVFWLGAVLLFLIYRSQLPGRRSAEVRADTYGRLMLVGTAVVAGLTVGAIAMLVHRLPGSGLTFVLPVAAVCFLVVGHEWRVASGAPWERGLRLLADVAVLSLGVAVPLGLFLVPFARDGALGDLWRGTFVTPRLRLTHAVVDPPELLAFVPALPLAAVVVLGSLRREIDQRFLVWASLPFCVWLLWPRSTLTTSHVGVLNAMRCLLPFLAPLACWLLLFQADAWPIRRRQEVFLLTASSAFVNLLQFPYATPIYACYVLPLVILAFLYLVRSQSHPPNLLHLYLLAFFLLFAVLVLNRRTMFIAWERYLKDPPTQSLNLPRAGLNVSRRDKDEYERLVRLVQQFSVPDSFVLATPDCPQVYFLAERRNPTRVMFEFFDDPRGRRERYLRLLQDRQIDVVVINTAPPFSAPIGPNLLAEIYQRYPCQHRIGDFVVAHRHATESGHWGDSSVRPRSSLRDISWERRPNLELRAEKTAVPGAGW